MINCKYKVKIKDLQDKCKYKIKIKDIQDKYRFKIFCSSYDDTEVKEDITEIQEEQIIQNNNIETLQEENEILKNIINQLPQVSGSGTEVTLNNTIESPMTQLDIKGNSTQDGTPTPNSPVEILSSGDNGSISEKIVNKNWLDINKCIMGANNTPVNSNVSFSTKTNRACTKYDVNPIICKPSTSHIVKFNTFYFSVAQLDINNKVLSDSGWKSANYTFTTNANARKIVMNFKKSDDSNFTIEEFKNAMIQVELGSTATTYTAHQEQTYTIPVQQPMRKIKVNDTRTVRDEFIQDTNGNWYERHNLQYYLFNGNEGVATAPSVVEGTTRFYMDKTGVKNQQGQIAYSVISNRFKAITWQQMYSTDTTTINAISNYNQYNTSSQRIVIRIDSTIASTIAELRTFLKNNETYCIYELDTPVDLPCTEEQISILENLPKSYNEQTNIYSLDVTPSYIEAKGLYDIKDLVARVEALEQ